MSIPKILITVFILFLLSACAKLPPAGLPAGKDIPWATRQAQAQELTAWKARGAIALRQGKRAENASFYLIQNADDSFELAIYGPLGIGRNILQGDGQKVTLRNAAGKIFTAATPEILLKEQLGWTLPVSNLHYWLRGIPAPLWTSEMKFDQYHRLSQLQQQGWSINYESYMNFADLDLPRKIIFQRQEVQATIAISRWEPLKK